MGGLNILLDGCKSGSGFLCVSGPFRLGGHLGYIYIFFPPSSILLDVISFFGEKLFEIFEAYDGAVP
jgi:hypothetical protein